MRLLAVLLWLLSVPLAAAERPNILFILTDDHAPWALSAAGDPNAKTPNLDRIFREGATLRNAFTTTPVCSPSRAGLMTSRYGSEVGITDWINPRADQGLGLDRKFPVWPELLQQAGYRTGLIGKWHLGDQPQHHPTKYGFGHFTGFLGGGSTPANPTLEVDGKATKLTGLLPDILTDEAIRFINTESDQPWLLSLHFRAPHAPWLPVAEEDLSPFKELDPVIPNPDYPNLNVPRVKQMTREYLASVASVDRNVGRLLAELEKQGTAKNTVVIYTSDHGYNMGHNGIWHKGNGHWVLTQNPPATDNIPNGQRPNMYDHSIRVPAAVRWPGVIRPGTVIQETISHLDWFPTLLAVAGAKPPAQNQCRGRNFLPLLQGEKPAWNNDFYAEYSTRHQSQTHMRMYRTPEWKLIRDFLNPGRDELYNLKDDPAETRNLIDSPDEIVTQVSVDLHDRLLKQMRDNHDPVLKILEQPKE